MNGMDIKNALFCSMDKNDDIKMAEIARFTCPQTCSTLRNASIFRKNGFQPGGTFRFRQKPFFSPAELPAAPNINKCVLTVQ
jgi:hypothetical protein